MTATSGYAGWRVALRLARREAWRRKGQTALMLVLIALPVLAVTAAAVVWKTATVSGAESVTRRMGAADAVVTALSGKVDQCFDPNDCSIGLDGGQGPLPGAHDVRAAVGDRPIVPLGNDMLSYNTTEGVGDLLLVETDLNDPLTSGLFRLREGRMPRTGREIVINPAAVARGPQLGQILVLIRKHGAQTQTYRLTVVGIADYANSRVSPYGGVLPGALGRSLGGFQRSWLVGGGPVSWAQVQAMNRVGLTVASRAVLTDPPPASELSPDVQMYREHTGVDSATITIIGLIVSMVLLEVVLLAGPAFAVRAKAQAHTLALVAATGGTPTQARRTILASGVVTGAVGGVVGAVLGVVLSYAAVPIAQAHSSDWFGPFEVPWALVAVVAGFGFLSAFLAAVVPAYSASRQDVVAVLAGRRGEGRPSRRSPFVGLVLIGLGIAGAVVGAGSPAGSSAALLVGGSAIVSVIGMIFFVPVAVTIVARIARRLPLPLRFAARDAARHRTRTVPAVAAVGATVAGVVTLSIALASQAALDQSRYAPGAADGYGVIALNGPAAAEAKATEVIHKRLPGVSVTPVVGLVRSVDVDFGSTGYSYRNAIGTGNLVADSVPAYLGLDPDSIQGADAMLRRGGVVLLFGTYDPPLPSGTVVARLIRTSGRPDALGRATLPALSVAIPDETTPVAAILSPVAAARLHAATRTVGLVVPPSISSAAEQDLSEALAASVPSASLYVERGFQPDSTTRIIQWVLALLGGILMLGGTLTATFLALSDAKPDLATMAAVGARPRTRRGVAAAYALVVGAVGALLGAPVGFIPGLAIAGPLTRDYRTGSTTLDIPWLLIGAIVVALPLLTAAVIGLFARSRLPLVARID